ncbi:hypothetical protein CSC76_17580, partial [Pseudoxanthomonas mexicana]
MWLRLAALAALAIAPCVHAQAPSPIVPPDVLTLDDAVARVARTHPDLRLIDARRGGLQAGLDAASLRPALRAGLDIENALGSGQARAFRPAETTLTLAGGLGGGGELDARGPLAQGRIDALAVKRGARRLDLLAETARRYLGLVAREMWATFGQVEWNQLAVVYHRLCPG